MYKAVHLQTGEEIIILHPAWRKRIGELRAMDHADLLVCQGCLQPLRVKAGEVKRAHFAHKHLKACSYGSESPEILNARAVLYEWLLREYCPGDSFGSAAQGAGAPGGARVTVEKKIDGVGLPRPVDAWVETGQGAIAYWIIEAGIKLEPRQAIRAAFERLGVQVHYLFLHAMLNEKKEELYSLLLTPTERAFLQPTDYDLALAGAVEAGKSIHYLDADGLVVTTYRSLGLHHAPNWYKGVKKVSKLAAVRANRASGEFVHRGEAEGLSKHRKRMARLEEKRKRYAQREAAWEERLARPGQDPRARWKVEPATRKNAPESAPTAAVEELPCAICGQITSDYWSTFPDATGRRLCRCRECLEREAGGG